MVWLHLEDDETSLICESKIGFTIWFLVVFYNCILPSSVILAIDLPHRFVSVSLVDLRPSRSLAGRDGEVDVDDQGHGRHVGGEAFLVLRLTFPRPPVKVLKILLNNYKVCIP